MKVDIQIGLTKAMYAFVASIMRIACSQFSNSINDESVTSALSAAFDGPISCSILDYGMFTQKVYDTASQMDFTDYYSDHELVAAMMQALGATLEEQGILAKVTAWQMAD